MIKLFVYIIVIPIVVFAVDSININKIFKNNKIYQAKLFYVLVIFGLSYLICNFIYDLVYMVR